jgi:hypothetical protein
MGTTRMHFVARALMFALVGLSTEAWLHQACAAPAVATGDLSQDSASTDEAFRHLQIAIDAINDAGALDARLDHDIINSITLNASRLQDLFAEASKVSSNPEYAVVLDYIASAVSAAASNLDGELSNQILFQIDRDLSIKLASARAALGSEGQPDIILVSVTTQRQGHGVNGYVVKASAALFGRSPPYFTFDDPATPVTTRHLVPGLYVFHAYDSAGVEVTVLNPELMVGSDGKDAANLSIAIE